MPYLLEPEKRVPITGHSPVVVAGGGFAGVSAALAAARRGADVMLIEKEYLLGGLGTAGLVTIYLPLCDGMGNQVSYGISEELLRLSLLHCPEKLPHAWLEGGSLEERRRQRFECQYNASLMAMQLEFLLRKAGVTILYGAMVCGVQKEDGRITSLTLESKSGRTAVTVDRVVDATGDADVCFLAGADTALYPKKNRLAAWYYFLGPKGHTLRILGASDAPEAEKEKSGPPPLNEKRYQGIDGMELSAMVQDAHERVYEDFLKNGGGDGSRVLTSIAAIPQIRMTRRLEGAGLLDNRNDHVPVPGSVGAIGDWRRRGPAYEIPYSCLYSPQIRNLIAAGRCISVTDDMWDLTRVIPACAVTGEAAGAAAALACDFPSLDVSLLQRSLQRMGARIHLDQNR